MNAAQGPGNAARDDVDDSAGCAPVLGFWFDYSSPYAYLAETQLATLARQTGAEVELRPVLLGAMFKTLGGPNVPLFAMSQPRQQMMGAELYRFADHFGVPFQFASRFPQNTVKALRITLACPEAVRPALVHALFSAMWAEDRSLEDDDELGAIAGAVGFDRDEARASMSSDAMRARLRETTDAALARGVFGVPTFEAGGELYWGQDRIDFVRDALLASRRRGS